MLSRTNGTCKRICGIRQSMGNSCQFYCDMGSNPVESTIEDVLTEYSGENPPGSVCWCRQSSKSRLLIHLLQIQIFNIIQYSPVAQLVEQWTVNSWVIGSRPVGGAMSLTKDSRKPQWLVSWNRLNVGFTKIPTNPANEELFCLGLGICSDHNQGELRGLQP